MQLLEITSGFKVAVTDPQEAIIVIKRNVMLAIIVMFEILNVITNNTEH